ncbi:hypothetical protein IV203_005493 [Nitzschia inconspicua]|uniref:Uncharacterized protein n=1 Tax=Nitzschia inconspicua TaxID=303405 RepID=A0A9K3KNZ9_9STRA|nr:hypothetical protein IV203_005493 [Nitzschia inconspicua]
MNDVSSTPDWDASSESELTTMNIGPAFVDSAGRQHYYFMMSSLADNSTGTTFGDLAPVGYADFHDDESSSVSDVSGWRDVVDDSDAIQPYNIDPAVMEGFLPLMEEIKLVQLVSTVGSRSSEESVVSHFSNVASHKAPVAAFVDFLILSDELASLENEIVETPATATGLTEFPHSPCNDYSASFDDQDSYSDVSTLVLQKLEDVVELEDDATHACGVPRFVDVRHDSNGAIDDDYNMESYYYTKDSDECNVMEHQEFNLESEKDDEAKALNSLFIYVHHFDAEVGITGAEALLLHGQRGYAPPALSSEDDSGYTCCHA